MLYFIFSLFKTLNDKLILEYDLIIIKKPLIRTAGLAGFCLKSFA